MPDPKPVLLVSTATAQFRAFLESAPSNAPRVITGLVSKKIDALQNPIHFISVPEIDLYCSREGSVRRFKSETGSFVPKQNREWYFISFKCKNCDVSWTKFALVIDSTKSPDVEVMKLGEYPPFAAPVSKKLEALLDPDNLALYRKGLECERQGLGIGAFGYYRRVVEHQWKKLITETRKAAERIGADEKELLVFDEALAETQFSQSVAAIKVPPSLLILKGQNPIAMLHDVYSTGLHAETDATCLESAADLRVVLTALIDRLNEVLQEHKDLEEAARRIQQRHQR